MPEPVSREETSRSSPQDFAQELSEALEEMRGQEVAESLRWGAPSPRTGEIPELDPWGTGWRTFERLAQCGTFPRGKVVLHFGDGTRQELGAHQCRTRFCPRCARRRGHRLGEEMEGAVKAIEEWKLGIHHVRFATYTLPNRENAAELLGELAAAWHRMLANRRFSRLVAGGFRCFEVKPGKDGKWNGHLHAILYLWVPGVPYAELRRAWDTAAQNPGQTYNQRFDELKKLAKPRPGETKAAAAARYLVKYLAKFEDLKEARGMPGGLPHLLAATEGRRMFSAWGIGAVARRKVRAERPRWAAQVRRHLEGYVRNDLKPVAAELDTPQGRMGIPIPFPALPARLAAEELPDQLAPADFKIRAIHAPSPLRVHGGLHLLPTQKKTLRDWMGWEDARRKARERIFDRASTPPTGGDGSPPVAPGQPPPENAPCSPRAEWLRWKRDNPRPELPEPFRWRAFWLEAPKEWTTEAHALLGERRASSLGAALWSRVRADEAITSPEPMDPRNPFAMMAHVVKDGLRSLKAHLGRLPRMEQRVDLLQTMPAHLAGKFVEADPWHDLEPWELIP